MAADDKSSSSSSTDWSIDPPVLSPTSPSHLTHFKPLTPEQDEPPLRSAYSSFVNLFRFSNKGQDYQQHWAPSLLCRRKKEELVRQSFPVSRKSDSSLSSHDPRTAVQLRTALKRLKEIMEGKSQVMQLKLTPYHIRYFSHDQFPSHGSPLVSFRTVI
uniref:Uncharacterized protein n=1 Tax=Periophthalmus magnuspinnatus TaxID=409849 RepID=A0A3B3ZKP4_9GOBI